MVVTFETSWNTFRGLWSLFLIHLDDYLVAVREKQKLFLSVT